MADTRAEDAAAFSAAGHALAAAIEALPFPVIAAVESPALGGGCELVPACDLAVAGEDATFGQIEGLGGVMPAFGGCWRLARRVGYQRSLEMMFTAAVITAQTAKAYGVVLDTVPAGKAVDAAMALAKRVVTSWDFSLGRSTSSKCCCAFGFGLSPLVRPVLCARYRVFRRTCSAR